MQSDKKNIDDIVRQKVENVSTDTANIDADWQQMKQLLIPATAVVAGKGLSTFLKGNIKLLSLVTAASGIALVTWLSNNNDHKNNNEKRVAANTASVNMILADTTKDQDTIIVAKPTEKLNLLFGSANWIGDNTPSTDEGLDYINAPSTDSVKNEKNLTEAEAQQVLNNFYDKIQKPDQEFVMDATKGGEINGNEGTKLTILPMALVDENNNPVTGQVKIILQEYYKYSDMVAANLTTMSNGQQLASGGMVYIKAMQNGKQLQLKDYSPVALSMPTNKFDPQMQLFTSYTGENKIEASDKTFLNQDTAISERGFNKDVSGNNSSISTRQINWTTSYNDYRYTRKDSIQFSSKIMIIDFEDNPYKVTENGKRKAFYAIPYDCKLSTQEVKKIMKEKNNGYYDKIFVKRKWRGKFTKDVVNDDHMIGDSTELYLQWALKWKYINKKDSLFYINEIIKNNLKWQNKNINSWSMVLNGNNVYFNREYFSKLYIKEGSLDSIYKPLVDSLNIVVKKKNDSLEIVYRKQDSIYFKDIYKNDSLVKDYKFSIKKLGWINCDRFTNYSNKTDYVIALPGKINTVGFTTNLVFTRVRSIMSGEVSENKIRFTNIPVGEPVYLIGLGTKDGKVVSFIEKLKVTSSEAKLNSFSNITPEEFKNKIAMLDMD